LELLPRFTTELSRPDYGKQYESLVVLDALWVRIEPLGYDAQLIN
jgi:hypothetical protein